MSRITRLVAACAAAASLAAAAAAPAPAAAAASAPCSVDYVPGCVIYAFDTAEAGIETVRRVYNDLWTSDPTPTCLTYEIITGEECPTEVTR